MDPLGRNSRCPKCDARLKGRRDTIGAVDATVYACVACGLYGVEWDDRVFDRKELGDEPLEAMLTRRAAKVARDNHRAQSRYVDAPGGRVWHD